MVRFSLKWYLKFSYFNTDVSLGWWFPMLYDDCFQVTEDPYYECLGVALNCKMHYEPFEIGGLLVRNSREVNGE